MSSTSSNETTPLTPQEVGDICDQLQDILAAPTVTCSCHSVAKQPRGVDIDCKSNDGLMEEEMLLNDGVVQAERNCGTFQDKSRHNGTDVLCVDKFFLDNGNVAPFCTATLNGKNCESCWPAQQKSPIYQDWCEDKISLTCQGYSGSRCTNTAAGTQTLSLTKYTSGGSGYHSSSSSDGDTPIWPFFLFFFFLLGIKGATANRATHNNRRENDPNGETYTAVEMSAPRTEGSSAGIV